MCNLKWRSGRKNLLKLKKKAIASKYHTTYGTDRTGDTDLSADNCIFFGNNGSIRQQASSSRKNLTTNGGQRNQREGNKSIPTAQTTKTCVRVLHPIATTVDDEAWGTIAIPTNGYINRWIFGPCPALFYQQVNQLAASLNWSKEVPQSFFRRCLHETPCLKSSIIPVRRTALSVSVCPCF